MKNTNYLLVFLTHFFILSSCTNNQNVTFENRVNNISKAEMQSVAEFLGNDILEGRAPGTRGGNLTEIYIKSLCKFLDLKPGIEGSYVQQFELKGFTGNNLNIFTNGIQLNYLDDIVGTFRTENETDSIYADAVFVGFGINADHFDWDDYKKADVKGKIVITRVNDPGLFNEKIFEGSTLTHYGRWDYHIEEAIRHGAAGILLIHTDQTAGYDWNLIKNSWTGEELYTKSQLQNNFKFSAWIKESSLKKLLSDKGITLENLYRKSMKKDFEPIDLGLKMKVSGSSSTRNFSCNNVIAEIPGKSKERIVLSAHIDHLGIASNKEGDSIYNGAIDNGTAVAAMMVVAKILKEYQNDLYYSVTILGCNAEESGLHGSRYYVENTNRKDIIANINFESTPVWDEAKSIMGIGARFSDFEDIIKELAHIDKLDYSYFSLSNQGLFFRSDQFSFAQYGIPSVWISAGEDELNGERNYTKFWNKDYHTVNDEYNTEWELKGMKQTIKYALLLINRINKDKSPPKWKDNLPFTVEEE